MKDEPEIVKILREEEKLGKLRSQPLHTYEEITIVEESPEEDGKNNDSFRYAAQNGTPTTKANDLKSIYQTVFENSAVAITLTDEKERIISWNKYTELLLGATREDLFMKPVKLLYPREEWKKIRSENVRQKGMQHHLETKMIRKNNAPLDVDISLSVLKNSNGDVIGSIGIIKDITQRKQMEGALKESEEKFKQLYEKAPIPYHTLSSTGEITNVSDKWCQILGYKKEEIIGKSIFDLIAENERKIAKVSFKEKIRSKRNYTGGHERTYITKNGEKRIFVINDFFSFDKHNNVTSVYTTMDDITERKKAEESLQLTNQELTILKEELSKLNQNLEKKVQERTADVVELLKQKDEFISQLGHDLKTPLSIILNVLPMIKSEVQDKELQQDCDIAVRNSNYISSLVTDTLKIAELGSPNVKFNMETLPLSDIVQDVISNKQLMLGEKHISFVNDIDEHLLVNGDKLRLGELLTNIITNGIKFTPKGGSLTIDAKQGHGVVTVSVTDTGIGLTKKQIEHIFDEFYKADKSRHEINSCGLGLSICKRIVEKHGGKIWAESPRIGKGTTITFTLTCEKRKREREDN